MIARVRVYLSSPRVLSEKIKSEKTEPLHHVP
jgi:hypothetical protein